MIDTHAHILPGLDDGPGTAKDALALIRMAIENDIDTIIATPHCNDGVFNCKKSHILQACRDLSHMVHDRNLPVRILPGAEVRLTPDLITDLNLGRILTLNQTGAFLLVELPPVFMPEAVVRIILGLSSRGVIPLIAHGERNPMLASRPELTAELVAAGASIQVTAGSLTGDFGKEALKAAVSMIRRDQVFCIGSDIHPGRRYQMKNARKKLIKLIGPDKAGKILQENPERILHGISTESGNRKWI